MIRSSRCMFEPRSLMMIVSGGYGIVSPEGVTRELSTPRSGSAFKQSNNWAEGWTAADAFGFFKPNGRTFRNENL